MKVEMPAIQTRHTREEIQAAARAMRECKSYSQGDELKAFEQEFAAYLGAPHAVGVSSATSALELAAMISLVGEGVEVVMPAHTFVSTAVPFARHGTTLRWADIDPDTRVISAESIRSLLTDRTKVVVVVHLYGLPADMDAIMALADQHGFLVVEDCAQAPGARYKGRRVGAIGHFGCFSFHTHKNINTLGEGGMLTVQDAAHAVAARRLRWMGNWPFETQGEDYWHPAMGDLVEPIPGRWPFNYCMGEPNAAVGRMLIKRLDAINEQRRRQAQRFMDGLGEYPELIFQAVPNSCEHAYHLMSARYDGGAYGKTRDHLIEMLFTKYRIKPVVQYWPLYRSELFRKFGFGEADVPEADRFFDNMLSFPWWSDMSEEILDEMADRTRRALEEMRTK